MSSHSYKKRVKSTKSHKESQDVKQAPHSFVIERGKVSPNVKELVVSMRKLMSPYTAFNLKVSKKNVIKDFVANAAPLNVSHLIIFSETSISPVLKIAKLPNGPTVYLRVNKFCTINDVLQNVHGVSLGSVSDVFRHQPLVAVNNFEYSSPHLNVTASMFQNMFPKLNVSKLGMNTIRRCVIFSYDPENDVIDIRQYRIRLLEPDSKRRSVSKLISGTSRIGDLNKYKVRFLQFSGVVVVVYTCNCSRATCVDRSILTFRPL